MTIDAEVVIVGGGPCGLFQVFELGLLGMRAHIIETLPKVGGQCSELYPDKPIYDIPALPVCGAQELIDRLQEQIKPFAPTYHLDQQVRHIESRADGSFLLETTAAQRFETRAIVIAGGVGSFEPVRLKVDGIETFLDQQLFYRVADPAQHDGKDVVVLGGGDSALDWALELAPRAKSMTLVHRSTKFRAAPASTAKMQELCAAGRMAFVQGSVSGFSSDGGRLSEIETASSETGSHTLPVEHLLVFFGLSPKLGPIADWGLNLDKNSIVVDTEKFESSVPGIYAVGDINVYPGKKKLILSGFHEAALAAFAIKARLFPDQKVHLQYTTTSPIMHKRLGVESRYRKTA